MTSHPHIATALSETEQRFVEFVEQHAYARDLPPDTIRLRIATTIDDDSYQELHSIEVSGDGGREWRIEHCLKREDLRHPCSTTVETHFELTGPGVPDGYGRRSDIESVIGAALDVMARQEQCRNGV